MSVRELGSQLEVLTALAPTAISTDTNTDGLIIDLARRPANITFFFSASAFTDGVFTATVFHGAASNLSDAAAVSTEMVVGQGSAPAATAIIGTNVWKKITVVATKRYVRLRIVSTATDAGATVQAIALIGPDVVPQT
jgi:hypothetical protein